MHISKLLLLLAGLPNLLWVLTEAKEINGSLSEKLWTKTETIRREVLKSPLIEGLRKKTLDPVIFGKYYMQDGVWCEEASKSMKIAAERTPLKTMRRVRGFLLQESLDYGSYASEIYSKWGILEGSSIQPSGGCQSYFEYERMVAETMDTGYFVACMIPCAKLWPWIGEQIIVAANQTDFGPYTNWVMSSFDPSYAGYETLDGLLDIMYDKELIDLITVADVYRNCMEGELDFFNSAK